MALPLGTTGSLGPAFAPARLVGLAVKRASALTLAARFPTVLSPPSSASVTLWEATAPDKLLAWHCHRPGSRAKLRTSPQSGTHFNDVSSEANRPASTPHTYPPQTPAE